MTTRASFRVFRSGLIGSIILCLAAGGHLAGGGRLPDPAILVALCAVAVVPVAALTRFRLSFPVLAGLIGAGQAWLHWSFSALSAGGPMVPVPVDHAGHAAAALPPEAAGSAMTLPSAGTDGLMLAAHAAATLGTALLLARGEQALSALASWLRPLVRLPEPVTTVPARAPGPAPAPLILPLGRPGRRLPTRRGPPAFMPAA